ncbi:MAG TPA: hypothetical protein PKW45_16850, partial [Bryobacteraceae bacterium]|nr:hypothetical protein [Bryobacteraceae bacterium]
QALVVPAESVIRTGRRAIWRELYARSAHISRKDRCLACKVWIRKRAGRWKMRMSGAAWLTPASSSAYR